MISDYKLLKFIQMNFNGDKDKVKNILEDYLKQNCEDNPIFSLDEDKLDEWKQFLPNFIIREICLTENASNATQKYVAIKANKNKPMLASDDFIFVEQRFSEVLKKQFPIYKVAVKKAKEIAKSDLTIKEKEIAAVLICEGYEFKYKNLKEDINERKNDKKLKINVLRNKRKCITNKEVELMFVEAHAITNYILNGGDKPALSQLNEFSNIEAHKIKRAIQKGFISYLKNNKEK